MKWTISRKLSALTLLSAVTIIVLTAVFVIVGLQVQDQLHESEVRSEDMAIAERLQLDVSEILLVAMDSIVDKEEGSMSQERIDALREASDDFRAGLQVLKEHAVNDSERADLKRIEESSAYLIGLVANDLANNIAALGVVDGVFGGIDERFDALSGEILAELGKLDNQFVAREPVSSAAIAQARLDLKELAWAATAMNLAAMEILYNRAEGQAAPEDLDALAEAEGAVRPRLQSILSVSRSGPVEASAAKLSGLFEELSGVVRNDLLQAVRRFGQTEAEFGRLDDVIDETGGEVQELLSSKLELLREKSFAAAEETIGLLSIMIWVASILGIVMLVVAIVATSSIGRSISNALRRFSDAMRDLAGGKLDVEVVGKGRSDEIGDMAEAFEVFKRNAVQIENRRIMEQKASQEIDAVVASAAQGDFTARVATAGKEGFMLSLSTSLNTLVETVERGLNEVMDVAGSLSHGELGSRVQGDYEGSFLQLKNDLNGMAEKLAELVSEIRGATDNVSNASGELGQGADDLAQRTEQQAANLEQTAAAMEEMTGSVKRNAENAQEANKLISDARKDADQGGKIVTDAVSAMAQIEESSRSISEIVNVIDDIAFQTNLLALNASVEAARAGEAGKGFAVVASEVRSLAQRFGDAASEIKQLISTSTGHVNSGVSLVNSAGEALNQIIGAVQKVATIIDEVARASEEQAGGVSEVNAAISQMDSMTQQNAALVEQTTAAVQAMGAQAQELVRLVGFFNVNEGTRQIRGRPDPNALPDYT